MPENTELYAPDGKAGSLGEDTNSNLQSSDNTGSSSQQQQNVNSTANGIEQQQQQPVAPPAKADGGAGQAHASPKKRRKVNHGMLQCARVNNEFDFVKESSADGL
jgi:hypothetical protein